MNKKYKLIDFVGVISTNLKNNCSSNLYSAVTDSLENSVSKFGFETKT